MKRNHGKEQEPYVAPIMARFCCNEDMAYTILRSAKKNGEMESIKKMCGLNNRRNDSDAE